MATITFSGIASGIDSASLIEATLAQKRSARIEPLETKITEFEKANSAYDELKEMLNNLKDSASKFRVINGSGISMQASSSDETVLTASVAGYAQTGSYSITTKQLARGGMCTLASDTKYDSADSVINADINNSTPVEDRTVNFTVGSGDTQETISITLDNSTTLTDFVSSFNSKAVNASATLVNRGTASNPDYVVMISSKHEGSEKGAISCTVGSEIVNSGTGAFNNNSEIAAQDAIFSIEGLGADIVRSSNTINDVINGVSFELHQQGESKINVKVDADSTIEVIKDFIDQYNEIVEYINENDKVTQDKDKNIVYGTLSKSSLDENILSSLRNALSTLHGTGSINILADLGIKTERDGTLSFDEDTCKEAIQNDSNGVANLLQNLGESLASTNGVINQYTKYNGLLDLTINSNKTSISSYNDKISTLEEHLSKQEESLIKRFAALESLMGQLQSQQSYISSLLPIN